jgi:hypothetical protein
VNDSEFLQTIGGLPTFHLFLEKMEILEHIELEQCWKLRGIGIGNNRQKYQLQKKSKAGENF